MNIFELYIALQRALLESNIPHLKSIDYNLCRLNSGHSILQLYHIIFMYETYHTELTSDVYGVITYANFIINLLFFIFFLLFFVFFFYLYYES